MSLGARVVRSRRVAPLRGASGARGAPRLRLASGAATAAARDRAQHPEVGAASADALGRSERKWRTKRLRSTVQGGVPLGHRCAWAWFVASTSQTLYLFESCWSCWKYVESHVSIM